MSDKMCNECKRCDGDLCTYFDNYSDRESTLACILFEPQKPTVFDYITQSEEKLAEKFIYTRREQNGDKCYLSTITVGKWSSRAEAKAATIEELKKEVENDCKI